MYKIKPLEWKVIEHDYPDLEELYESITPICLFRIESYADREGNIWWGYGYCFEEYHDDGGDECLNLQDGKNACEKIWEERLKKCLIEV